MECAHGDIPTKKILQFHKIICKQSGIEESSILYKNMTHEVQSNF